MDPIRARAIPVRRMKPAAPHPVKTARATRTIPRELPHQLSRRPPMGPEHTPDVDFRRALGVTPAPPAPTVALPR